MRAIPVLPVLFSLVGCGGAQTGGRAAPTVIDDSDLVFAVITGLADVDAAGTFLQAGSQAGTMIADNRGGGVASGFFTADIPPVAGSSADGTVALFAGIMPETAVGFTPRAGRGTFRGTYGVTRLTGFEDGPAGQVIWNQTQAGGAITIEVNFNLARLEGRSADRRLRLQA